LDFECRFGEAGLLGWNPNRRWIPTSRKCGEKWGTPDSFI
jgi:hypothetical protein